MGREKVVRVGDRVEVVYSSEQWRLLREKRKRALEIVKALRSRGLSPIVHGSIARGDVTRTSDVDVVITQPTPPYLVEISLELAGLTIHHKAIVQATPNHTPKVYLFLSEDELECVSFPLNRLKPRELEFYRFGGLLDHEGLSRDLRVPGVNKRLLLILPTEKGHVEEPIIGREEEVARLLKVSLETVRERVRVLTRRDAHGRTGVFVKRVLPAGASVEEEVERLKRGNPAFRRAVEG